jgi:hypothetical protein
MLRVFYNFDTIQLDLEVANYAWDNELVGLYYFFVLAENKNFYTFIIIKNENYW